MKYGIIVTNIGSPDAPECFSVMKYLREFLGDSRVLDVWFSKLLLYLIILPFRSPKSAKAYKKVWLKDGSPLIVNTVNFVDSLQKKLGEEYKVTLGMRYGKPNITKAINSLVENGVDYILIFPAFPHYASSTTGSIAQEAAKIITKKDLVLPFSVMGAFYNHPAFITYWVQQIGENISNDTDCVLFSYHGLPVRHISRLGDPKCCASNKPCPSINSGNRFCYRAQCYETTRLIVQQLNLRNYFTAFQSRLGKEQWAMPYTDEILDELYQKGFRRIVVVSPAFVADCIETIEEIGMEAKKQWEELGGESFTLVSCPNAHETWVNGAAQMIKEQCPKLSC